MAATPRDPNSNAFTLAVLMQHAGKLLDDGLRIGFERFGLHPSQGRVLHLLERKGRVEQRALAETMNVSAPTMSGILKRMEAEELIERGPDPDDEPLTRVSMTSLGRRKCKVVREVVHEVEDRLVAGLNKEQLRSAHSLLRLLRANLGGEAPGPEPSVEEIIP